MLEIGTLYTSCAKDAATGHIITNNNNTNRFMKVLLSVNRLLTLSLSRLVCERNLEFLYKSAFLELYLE